MRQKRWMKILVILLVASMLVSTVMFGIGSLFF